MSFNRPHPSTKFQAFVFGVINDLDIGERMVADVYWQEETALILLPTRIIGIEDDETEVHSRTISVKNFTPGETWGTL